MAGDEPAELGDWPDAAERPQEVAGGPWPQWARRPQDGQGLRASFGCPELFPQPSSQTCKGPESSHLSRRGPAQPGGARAPPTCSGSSPPSALWGPGLDGRGSHLAKLASGRLSGAALGSLSQGESSRCPRLGSTDRGLGRTPHHCPDAFLPGTPFFRPGTPRPREAEACLGWHSQAGAHQDADPRPPAPAPLWHSPTSAPGGLEGGGGTWCQAAEAGVGDWRAPCTTAPPPRLPSLAPSTRLPSCRHIRPGPDINPHQGPGSLFLCCPPLPSPTRAFFFVFFSSLSSNMSLQ